MEPTQKFVFKNTEIDFQFDKKNNVMVNATQMAKIFGKHVSHFTDNELTQKFINASLNKRNSVYLNIKIEEDLINSKPRSGTFMHRVLALKFAAWLNSDFEVWVYKTIDFILFDYYKRLEESLKESAKRKNRIEEIEEKLQSKVEYQELKRLEVQEKQASYIRNKQNRRQLDIFRNNN